MTRRLTRARVRSVLSRARASLRTRAHHAVLVVNPAAFSQQTDWRADFGAWAGRGTRTRTGAFPDAWRTRADLPIVGPARVAVLLHVYYPELVDELLEGLAEIPVAFDLIVTNASPVPVEIDRGQLPNANAVVVLDVENRGRDIWPLVQVVNAGLLDPYHIVLKVHT